MSRWVGLFSQRGDNIETLNVTPQADANQQLLAAIKAKDATTLYRYAQDNQVEMSLRVRAIEALGQLHDPNIGTWLNALMQAPADADSHADIDIQKLAYKVLRRWQRAIDTRSAKTPTSA